MKSIKEDQVTCTMLDLGCQKIFLNSNSNLSSACKELLINAQRSHLNGMISLFFLTFIGLISLSGIAVNAYIIFVIALAKQVNTANGILLAQTSALEIALSMSVLTCNIPNMILENTIGYCSFCGVLIGLLRPIAVWTVCGLNCDRYYAISAPLHYASLVNSKKILTAIGITWISFLILYLPLAVAGVPYTYNNMSYFCVPQLDHLEGDNTFFIYYTIMYTTITFILPFILVCTCNTKVFMIARHHKHRIASAIFEVTLSAQVTITHQKNPFSPSGLANRFREGKASLTVIQLVGSFLIVYGPYYSTALWQSARMLCDGLVPLPSYLVTGASVLLFCSSLVNGILYGVKSKVLKKTFQNYWRKKRTKNDLNQEIQARTPSTCGSRRPSLTPAVGLFSKPACRRLSEFSLETQKSNLLVTYPRFQGNVNTHAWRTGSTPGLEPRNESFRELRRTRSFRSTSFIGSLNSLKFTNKKGEEYIPLTHRVSVSKNQTIRLHRFKRCDHPEYESLGKNKSELMSKNKPKSPKILITRAFSEENESTADKSMIPPKPSSSVTTLLIDSAWKSLSRERIAFNKSNPVFIGDYTDESGSDESQEELREGFGTR